MLTGAIVLIIDSGEVFPNVSGTITIEKDEDWENYSFQGTGSQNDPFIIDNYVIKTDEDYCVFISETEKSFIIDNDIVKNKGLLFEEIINK